MEKLCTHPEETFQLNPASLCAHKDARLEKKVILKVCPALATPVDYHAGCVGIQGTVQLNFF